jgi:hypothetical protein
MKEKIKKSLIILAVVAVAGFFGHKILEEDKQEDLREDEEKQAELKKEQTIQELVNKYNALDNWDKNIDYTIQLQDLLISPDRPILFTGNVEDVFKKDNKYFISFTTDWYTMPEINFVLECNYDKILIILNMLENDKDSQFYYFFSDYGNYAVIARIDDIKKVKLQITGYPEGEGEARLEYAPTDTFIATGECIDFSYIGED